MRKSDKTVVGRRAGMSLAQAQRFANAANGRGPRQPARPTPGEPNLEALKGPNRLVVFGLTLLAGGALAAGLVFADKHDLLNKTQRLIAQYTAPDQVEAEPVEEELTAVALRVQPVGQICSDDVYEDVRSTRIAFEAGSHELTPQARAAARQVAQRVAGCDMIQLVVTGHASSDADGRMVHLVSWRRAEAVINSISEAGFDTGMYRAQGVGLTSAEQAVSAVTFDVDLSELEAARTAPVDVRPTMEESE
ncbi:OmpA family protein [Pontivivens ytuae]|uniref:OmpA family protein n=1 Tax=Pontivivens ytuae TaxID=2789856 RepID=A0A7S9LP58_9RHOB|nr:OmpA family protein [Pontivivens ytuae]QPH52674.1 OmpA family protein [Pontivivens ytuae]